MELFRALIVLVMITFVGLLLLKVVDMFATWYENQGLPQVSRQAEEAAKVVDNATGHFRKEPYNPEDYDIYSKAKPYFQPLDVALAVAFLSALVGVFIYNRERT